MIERHLIECPKCGARGGCAKHGLSASGIDLRERAYRLQDPLRSPYKRKAEL